MDIYIYMYIYRDIDRYIWIYMYICIGRGLTLNPNPVMGRPSTGLTLNPITRLAMGCLASLPG